MGHCWGSSWARFTDAKKGKFSEEEEFLGGFEKV